MAGKRKVPLSAPTAVAELRVELVDLDAVVGRPDNAKDHDVGAIIASMRRFGYVTPLQLDEATGKLTAGHGRVKALRAIREAGEPAPARVLVRDGRWLVPAVRGARFADDLEAAAFSLADNRLVELGGWLDQALVLMLQTLPSLEGTGFDQEDLDRMVADLVRGQDDDEAVAEPPENPRVKLGQLWILGPHRLLCGDCTRPESMKRLLGGARPELCVTDPPYGVDYDPEWRDEYLGASSPLGAGRRTGKVRNDSRADWLEVWRQLPSEVLYVWHAAWFGSVVQAGLESAGFNVRAQIIWKKAVPVISRGHYNWQHETCWYAVRAGKDASWIGDHSQTTVWESGVDPAASEGSTHSTQKPIALMLRAIGNHSGDVLDPFCGTGTTLIAAHRMGRRGFALELDPGYCDVILDRFERETGEAAQLDG